MCFSSSIHTSDHGQVIRCTKCRQTIFSLTMSARCAKPDRAHSVQWTLPRLTLKHSHWFTHLLLCNYLSFNDAGSSSDLHNTTCLAVKWMEKRIYRGLIRANILEFELKKTTNNLITVAQPPGWNLKQVLPDYEPVTLGTQSRHAYVALTLGNLLNLHAQSSHTRGPYVSWKWQRRNKAQSLLPSDWVRSSAKYGYTFVPRCKFTSPPACHINRGN
jgi:hypothetical protein